MEPAAERIFGYTANEAIGQSIRLIVPPAHYAEEDDVLQRIERVKALTITRRFVARGTTGSFRSR